MNLGLPIADVREGFTRTVVTVLDGRQGVERREPQEFASYRPRLVEALGVLQVNGRQLKAYAMYADPKRRRVTPDLASLRSHAAATLPKTLSKRDQPLGFLVLHYGAEGDYLVAGQWHGEDMLKHWLGVASTDGEGAVTFTPVEGSDIISCVWELELIAFERDAWVNTVLVPGVLDSSTTSAYLTTTFRGWL